MNNSFSALPQDILAADTSFTERKIFDLAYADRSPAQKTGYLLAGRRAMAHSR